MGGFAARDNFTLDQVDDLRMAVEEAAVQLLRHLRGDRIHMHIETTDIGVEVRLSGLVEPGTAVIDETSFSWVILRALADDLRVESRDDRADIVLAKQRIDMEDVRGDVQGGDDD